eukprot:5386742-Amphidinium_carterae.1
MVAETHLQDPHLKVAAAQASSAGYKCRHVASNQRALVESVCEEEAWHATYMEPFQSVHAGHRTFLLVTMYGYVHDREATEALGDDTLTEFSKYQGPATRRCTSYSLSVNADGKRLHDPSVATCRNPTGEPSCIDFVLVSPELYTAVVKAKVGTMCVDYLPHLPPGVPDRDCPETADVQATW